MFGERHLLEIGPHPNRARNIITRGRDLLLRQHHFPERA